MNTKTVFPTLGIDAFDSSAESGYKLLRHEVDGKSRIEKPHKHDFFMLFVVREGLGTHSIDFEDYAVRDRQVHLLFPGQVHRWELSQDTTGFQLMVGRRAFETSSNFLRLSFILYRSHQVIDLPEAVFETLCYELEALEKELAASSVDWDMVQLRSRVALQLVSREAEHIFDDIGAYRANPILPRYHALVDAHFRTHKNVAFYADQLNISPNYLNILCKRHLHVPATFLIHHRVGLESKRLLLVSGQSAKEIAFELGFSDLPHFSNFFKAQTGLSPRAFRNQL
ncbi:AraC family transcriptional regulator [Dyadobacter beijingensis]|uniref:AraC family transcriptional regulator n=1 Tax=Dyadobacter beijingensis TaxID=365489 RepID=A0ABQ2IBA2_9BACT|nr:helix-turn-helix domain-containing protein [Dyadobacter beijingensis]GGN03912.1 AraC family transcriptional regulator [Dyadobacter beijingensis]